MHCQPDTGDELYYVTSEKVDIVPEDLQSTKETLYAGCFVERRGPLTQVAYDGRPAPADVEDKLNERRSRKTLHSKTKAMSLVKRVTFKETKITLDCDRK